MASVVAVGVSADVTCADFVFEKLGELLEDWEDFELVALNDKNHLLNGFAQSLGKPITHKSFTNRVGARQALSKATHLVVFWSGHDLHDAIFTGYANKLRLKVFPISVTTVVNRDSGQAFDIYIGRGTPLGNPFPIEHGTDKDRANVIERYREHFYQNVVSNPEMHQFLESLRGLRLGCHCKPLPCHGDIIADYLNNSKS